MIKEKYQEMVLRIMPRILTLLDRDLQSLTYGCFDRSFWHYKFITDYPCARYQEAVQALALVYKNNFPGNIYYNRKEILGYIKAGLFYWCKIQNKDGSFNEAYPNEHSFVATAFSLYAVTETVICIRDEISEKEYECLLDCLTKGGRWLSRRSEFFTANHIAGAMLALYNLYILTGESFLKVSAYKKLEELKLLASDEGWFKEYEGADVGYLTLTIDYLVKFYIKTQDIQIFNLIEKALNFLCYFVHPDGTLGGDYGSRNTEFAYFCGLELIRNKIPKAGEILTKLYLAFDRYDSSFNAIDDRYLAFEFSNFVEAFFSHNDFSGSIIYSPFEADFPEAGLFVKCTDSYYSILNYKKGGVLKIFSLKGTRPKLIFSDSGYLGKVLNGDIFTTQNYLSEFEKINPLEFVIKAKSVKINSSLPLVKLIVPFRIFNYFLCRFSNFGYFFSKALKEMFFEKKKVLSVWLEKRIKFLEDKVIINEKIYFKEKFEFFKKMKSFVPQLTASTRYFQENIFDLKYEFGDIANEINSGITEFKEEVMI